MTAVSHALAVHLSHEYDILKILWIGRYTDLHTGSDNRWRVQIYSYSGYHCLIIILSSIPFFLLTLFHRLLSLVPFPPFLLSFFLYSLVYSYFWYGSKHNKSFATRIILYFISVEMSCNRHKDKHTDGFCLYIPI